MRAGARARVCVVARARACACVHVALLTLHATRRHIAICGFSVSAIFSTLSHKGYGFRKNVTEYKMYILTFPTTWFEVFYFLCNFETFLILRRIQSDIVIILKIFSRKVPVIFDGF